MVSMECMVVHHGGTLHGGHYTAFVMQRPQHGPYHSPPLDNTSQYNHDAASTDRWYDIDDSYRCVFSEV